MKLKNYIKAEASQAKVATDKDKNKIFNVL